MSDQLQEKFNALFPTWTTVLATILAILLLIFMLSKFLYGPVKKMHNDRKTYIQNNINEAEKLNQDAYVDREKANDEIIQARLQATEIIAAARLQAQEVKSSQVALAEKEVARMMSDAKREIEAQQNKFDVESKEAIIEVALAAASEVIEKEVDAKIGRKIVEDFIKAK